MSLLNPSKGWRSSSSRLLALYSFLFVAWSGILLGVLYWEVTSYLGNLARHSLMQRQHLFARFEGDQLVDALATSMTFDMRAVDAYGLFDENQKPLYGPIHRFPAGLPMDGQIHELATCVDSDDPNLPRDSCDAVAAPTRDGRWLVLVRDNGSLFAVTTLILHALFWGISLTITPALRAGTCCAGVRCGVFAASRPVPKPLSPVTWPGACRCPIAATSWTCWRSSSTPCSTVSRS